MTRSASTRASGTDAGALLAGTAAYVYLFRDGEVLLQQRAGTGYLDGHWAGVAGHVEPGESVLAAAVREAREEVGVEVTVAAMQPLCAMHRTQRNGRAVDERVDFYFGCTQWAGKPSLHEADKADAIQWCPMHTLPDPVVPHELVVLDAVRRGTVPAVLTFGF